MKSSAAIMLASSVVCAAFVGTPAVAGVSVYSGEDIMATTSSAHPVSALAASNFAMAAGGLGATSLITFEAASLGSFSNLTVATGVTINGSDVSSANQTIRDTSN